MTSATERLGFSRPDVLLRGFCSVCALGFVLVCVPLTGCKSCSSRRELQRNEPKLAPYPTCAGRSLPEGELIASGELRASPYMRNPEVRETWSLLRRDCLYAVKVRHSWRLGTTDLELLYDERWEPIRIWKRLSLPKRNGKGFTIDTRIYDLSGDAVVMGHRDPAGTLRYEALRGPKPKVIVATGRGALVAWVKMASLRVGQKSRAIALDLRQFEKVKQVTLMRKANRQQDDHGEVRVYTVFGREAFFTDADGAVVGDLAGMRPAAHFDDRNEPVQLRAPTVSDPTAPL